MKRRNEVLLYSGGLDSVIGAYMNPDANLLFINVGDSYNAKEQEYIQQSAPNPVIVVDDVVDIGRYVRNNGTFLPNRNAILCLIASYYGERVLLCGTAGDIHPDKDARFIELMTQLLAHTAGNDWSEGGGTKFALPFALLTKGEMVHAYLLAGHPVSALRNSVSCYTPDAVQCGTCKPCLRKFFALEHNGISTTGIYENDPKWNKDLLRNVSKQIDNGMWCNSDAENAYTLRVIKRYL